VQAFTKGVEINLLQHAFYSVEIGMPHCTLAYK